jgi:3-deoxy-D-manno-octulosonic acid kinase
MQLWIRSDVRPWLVPIFRAAGERRGEFAGPNARELAGGRGGAKVVDGPTQAVVVRPFRRGGLPAAVLFDLYFGWTPRPFREVDATEGFRRRGAPVVEVLGAAVHWLVPGCYRGWLATRYLPGACTLWEWASGGATAAERRAVFRKVGAAIRRLHECGGRHPDLNLTNILVHDDGGAVAVVLIDFDRGRRVARWYRTADADLARLRRSAHKLDPQGTRISEQDLTELEAAYRGVGA